MAKRKREKELKDIAIKGQYAGQLPQFENLSNGLVYREYGDIDPSNVVDVPSLTYHSTGYNQSTTALGTWVNVIQRTGEASNGDYIMHQRKIYIITGQSTADQVKF